MRKIISKHQEGKKVRRNQIIVGVILIFVMFFSVLGYSFQGSDEGENKKINYRGYSFVNQNGFWVVKIGDFNFGFRYNPTEVEKIDSPVNYLSQYSNRPLYVSSENDEASSEIYLNLNQVAVRTQLACLSEENCEGDLPIKTCEDNFIIIEEAEVSNISQEENCVFIRGPSENLVKLTDEFLFKVLGIE